MGGYDLTDNRVWEIPTSPKAAASSKRRPCVKKPPSLREVARSAGGSVKLFV